MDTQIQQAAAAGEIWLTAAQVRARQGGIRDMSLWRWTNDPDMRFPQPDDRRNRLKYWHLSTILQWEAARATKARKAVADLERQIERDIVDELCTGQAAA